MEVQRKREHEPRTPDPGVFLQPTNLRPWPDFLVSGYAKTCGHALFLRHAALRQQKPPQTAEIVEDSPAGGDVQVQFRQIVRDQEEGLFAPFGAFLFRQDQFRFDIASSFVEGFRQQGYVFVGAFDAVKRRSRAITHRTTFPPRPEKSGARPSL
jgi:hypothetical protein